MLAALRRLANVAYSVKAGTGGSIWSHEITTAADKHCQVAITPTATAAAACEIGSDTAAKIDKASKNLKDLHNVKVLAETDYNAPPLLALLKMGEAAASIATPTYTKGFCHDNGNGNGIPHGSSHGFGISTLTKKPGSQQPELKAEKLTGNGDRTGPCLSNNIPSATDKITTAKQVASAICSVRGKTIQTIPRPAAGKVKDIKASEAAKEAVQLLSKGQIEAGADSESVGQELNKILGGDDPKISETFVTKVDNDFIEYNGGGGKGKATLAPASTAADIAAQIKICFCPPEATAAKKKQVDSLKDKECSSKKGTECKGECEWDRDKET
ncbi:uncharacterized protein TEOVI_000569600 [Trypanosoma equiperdum]|uniref:Uncharacterized protein n=1 Tax=Trypanosoma equiperdum TaxID=5694 RepID=A0A1G4HYX2_TRYEQ|nr:hypothetical protein TEOVI_000569600 [Trypanosoma equiperdum]